MSDFPLGEGLFSEELKVLFKEFESQNLGGERFPFLIVWLSGERFKFPILWLGGERFTFSILWLGGERFTFSILWLGGELFPEELSTPPSQKPHPRTQAASDLPFQFCGY